MDTKTYQVGFFRVGRSSDVEDLSRVFASWEQAGSSPVIRVGSNEFKIKGLVASGGSLVRGVFAKFRHDDLPKIGSSEDDSEKDIDLDDEEGLIEKNHFLYDKKMQLLVYQQNKQGSGVTGFAEYLTLATEATTVFNPIVQPDAMRRILKGNFKPKKISFSVARPAPEFLDAKRHALTRNLMKIMNDGGAYNINMTMSLGKRGGYLTADVMQSISELISNTSVRTAKIDVEDVDGITHPIDLIADRVKDEITVKMVGRYPDAEQVFRELTKSKHANEGLIRSILG